MGTRSTCELLVSNQRNFRGYSKEEEEGEGHFESEFGKAYTQTLTHTQLPGILIAVCTVLLNHEMVHAFLFARGKSSVTGVSFSPAAPTTGLPQ